MRPIPSFFIFLFLTITGTNAQVIKLFTTDFDSVSKSSLETFKSLVSEENYKEIGFESPKDIYSATLDTPIVDFFIPLDQLIKYEPNNNPDDLLRSTNRIYYPVLVNTQVRSSITLSKIEGKWQAVSFGSPIFIGSVTNTLKQSMKESKLNYSEYFVVRIPSLNIYFLAYRSQGELLFVPLLDDTRLGFKSGVSLLANKALIALLPEAKAQSDVPR